MTLVDRYSEEDPYNHQQIQFQVSKKSSRICLYRRTKFSPQEHKLKVSVLYIREPSLRVLGWCRVYATAFVFSKLRKYLLGPESWSAVGNRRMTAQPAHLKLLQRMIQWWLCEVIALEVTLTKPSVQHCLCFMVIDKEIFCNLCTETQSPPEIHFLLQSECSC